MASATDGLFPNKYGPLGAAALSWAAMAPYAAAAYDPECVHVKYVVAGAREDSTRAAKAAEHPLSPWLRLASMSGYLRLSWARMPLADAQLSTGTPVSASPSRSSPISAAGSSPEGEEEVVEQSCAAKLMPARRR
eukprot:scaffold70035_cov36-Prasinocladus_malaysianus.AAC.1